MASRLARLLLAGLLLSPLAATLWLMDAARLDTRVLAAGASRMLGPNNPPVIDTNGDGLASPGDQTVGVSRAANAVTVGSPWDCTPGDGDNVFSLMNSSRSPASRTTGRRPRFPSPNPKAAASGPAEATSWTTTWMA